jgi:pilus assembly protein CpaE
MTLRLWISGDWNSFGALHVGLMRAGGVRPAQGPEEADVVVHATAGGDYRDELALVREHAVAPIVLLMAPAASHSVEAVISLAQELAVAVPVRPSRGRVLTVFSPKGGAGTSLVSTALAGALAAARRVLLVDLAAALESDHAEAISDARVAQLLDAARGEYDVVVVDAPRSFGGQMLAALDRTDELVLLCTPDVPSIKDVRLTLETLDLLSFPRERVRIVLNRVHRRPGGIRAAQVSAVLGRSVELQLPEDDAVTLPEGAFARAVAALAAVVDTGAERRRRFALGRRS